MILQLEMKQKIAITIAYVLALVAIAISLLRCEPFTIDAVAVLATILSLLVTILLGIIAYNYFIQRDEIKNYKKEVGDTISREVLDVYIGMMSSYGAQNNATGVFTIGVKVLSRFNGGIEQDITRVCTLLNKCYLNLTDEDKSNAVIKTYLVQLRNLLKLFKNNVAAMQLLAIIGNE